MIYLIAIIFLFIVLYCLGGRYAAKWFPDEVHFLPLPVESNAFTPRPRHDKTFLIEIP